MKNKLLLLIIGIAFLNCEKKSKFVKNSENHKNEYQFKQIVTELGQFADTTFTDAIKLNTILEFKTIDLNGLVKKVEMRKVINLYLENIENEKRVVYPIFEIRNTSKVILPIFGQGIWDKIWGKVIIDKNTLEIVNIEFSQKDETNNLEGKINESTFKSQFIGTKIDLSTINYALYQKEIKVIDGKQKINAVSGATITSKGVIDMLNTEILKYKDYLR